MATLNGTAMSPHIQQDEPDPFQNQSVEFKPTTNTALINPVFSSVSRVTASEINKVHTVDGTLTQSELQHRGKRPSYGLQYPRGYYNK